MRAHRKTAGLLALVLCTLLFTNSIQAWARPLSPQVSTAELTTPEALESFVDGVIGAQISAYHIAGVTVSVVKDGELFFAKGYGDANVERGIPVRADETLFRVGSVSKLFTWTAVMQLVEQGMLDLDTDIRQYLDFELQTAHAQALTLRHLLTHTPGFEDQGLGLFSHDFQDLRPLGEQLANAAPRQVYPPGEISAYSNYGAGLAGYIVERVSGMPFDDYIDTHILRPLGMNDSSFRQPLPAELAENMSVGYTYSAGRFHAQPFEVVQPAPAGSLSATATDMAAFMIAHLQNGRYGDTRILEEDIARAMHSLQFSHDERLAGWGYGFSVDEQGSVETFGHGGDTIYFHSELMLLPEHNVGVFISTNTDTGTFARFDFMQAFLKRYFAPTQPSQPHAEVGSSEQWAKVTGTYYPARMSYSSIEKILNLMNPLNVSISQSGELVTSGLVGPDPIYWAEAEPRVFMPVSGRLPGNSPLIFRQAQDGDDIRYAFWGAQAYIKQPWYATTGTQFLVLGVSLLGMLVALIGLPVGAWNRRIYASRMPREQAPHLPPAARLLRWVTWAIAALALVFWLIFSMYATNIYVLVFGFPPLLQAAIVIPWLLLALTLVLLALVGLGWVRGWGSLAGRVGYSLFALLAVLHIWFLAYWNLLSSP